MDTIAFAVNELPADVLDEVRTTGLDASGNAVAHVVAGGGEPLRCCLRNAEGGEELILFGFEPPIPTSPFREVGAVFAHSARCAGPASSHTYPADWRGKPQVLRAYDERGWIHPATTAHDGTDPEPVISRILADPTVAQLHSRNIEYGCYMFEVSRAR
ncbi:DUF1203 domain-containing protein [Pseudonocardia sp. TRM90224]|uniref:DUF1203 domain-containing protein n=1 Tax=Pseudonocardia sp. TRM90224 TaxID=2812678 RepID=UPI001E50B160|nr:DUF1203 domain-containing protein [Pseudonocardia sp. TRM90224]